MTESILKGEYVYDEVYPAFKAGTDEKEKTARLNQLLFQNLAKQGIVLFGKDSVKVADIGCGPADTVIKYLRGVEFEPGYDIRATDYLEDYAGPGGKAAENLRSAQSSGTVKIRQFSVKQGNAFTGKLVELLSTPEDPEPAHTFALSFLSHIMYHAHAPADIDTVLKDVACNVLEPESVGVLYHVAHRSKGTFQYFRDRFGSRFDNTKLTDTPTMNIHDPPTAIQESCKKNRIPCDALNFSTKLFFNPISEMIWNAFKHPDRYQTLSKSHPNAFEDLKRLYFIVQRSPLEFAADSSSTGLEAFLEEAREAIQVNDGHILLEETLQIVTPPNTSSRFLDKIHSALSDTQQQIPELE